MTWQTLPGPKCLPYELSQHRTLGWMEQHRPCLQEAPDKFCSNLECLALPIFPLASGQPESASDLVLMPVYSLPHTFNSQGLIWRTQPLGGYVGDHKEEVGRRPSFAPNFYFSYFLPHFIPIPFHPASLPRPSPVLPSRWYTNQIQIT